MENTNNQPGEKKTLDIPLRQCFIENYDKRKKRSLGLITGIPEIDKVIKGMDKGSVNVIAAFPGHYKTMSAVNIARLNAYENGYNIVYISLETPKEILYDQLLSRHSCEPKFAAHPPISHERIRCCELLEEEKEYLHTVIESDFYEDYMNDKNELRKPGHVTFLDTSDFKAFDYDTIKEILIHIDDKMLADEKKSGGLDAVIVDYVQLCKFMAGGFDGNDNRIVNMYVTFFRDLAQGFRLNTKTNEMRTLAVILLSQINRESYAKALKNGGQYNLTCLADANELERSASRIITTYAPDDLKIAKEAQVQLIKNRFGATINDPVNIYADPVFYLFSDLMQSTMNSEDMDAIFGSQFNYSFDNNNGVTSTAIDLHEFDI